METGSPILDESDEVPFEKYRPPDDIKFGLRVCECTLVLKKRRKNILFTVFIIFISFKN